MPAPDPDTRAHLEWLGFIQPSGLVVSAPALVKAGAILNRQDAEGQGRLAAYIREHTLDPERGPEPCLPDFREFAAAVLGWGFSPRGYAGTEEAPTPPDLEVPLPDYRETLRPHFAVRERGPQGGRPPWQLLVQVLDPGQDFDAPAATTGGGAGAGRHPTKPRVEASPHGRCFHDPYENGPEIAELRDLHAAMDRAVLDAYGWNDLPTDYDFLLDHEIDEAAWGRKKKPYRYRWPDTIRDAVLARLLALNAGRAAEEACAGAAHRPEPTPGRPRRQAAPR